MGLAISSKLHHVAAWVENTADQLPSTAAKLITYGEVLAGVAAPVIHSFTTSNDIGYTAQNTFASVAFGTLVAGMAVLGDYHCKKTRQLATAAAFAATALGIHYVGENMHNSRPQYNHSINYEAPVVANPQNTLVLDKFQP